MEYSPTDTGRKKGENFMFVETVFPAAESRGRLAKTALAIAALLTFALPAAAEEKAELDAMHRDYVSRAPSDPTEEWAIAWGGRLYDKWWEALEKDQPKQTHAAYPATSQQKGAGTWRCKECHGWDYKGAAGAYAKGKRFTGIKGVTGAAGKDPKAIAAMLRDKTHGYTAEMIPDAALNRLALFVSKGQHDADSFVDGATKKAKGDAARGRVLYQNQCAACHGFDGKSQNFGDEKAPEYIGTIGVDNPWEMLHKIRNGHPASFMPAMRGFDTQFSADILAYTQGLPAK
jgi:thiosulfate dehydrogenase